MYSPKEAYIDAVVQGTWYTDATSHSFRIGPLKTRGTGIVGSVEAGYPFVIKPSWILEPQIQGVFQSIDLHETRDIGGLIRFDDVDSVTGRIGVRLAHKQNFDKGAKEKTLTTWFRPNVWYQFRGDPKASFN